MGEPAQPTPQRPQLPEDTSGALVKALLAVVEKLQEPPYLFVTGFGILMVLAFIASLVLKTFMPLYVTIGALVTLAFVALGADMLTMRMNTSGSEPLSKLEATKKPVREPKEKGGMNNITPDYGSLKRQLEMARKTLDALKMQEAGYTVLTMPAHLRVELGAQQRKVADLERQLTAYLRQEENNER